MYPPIVILPADLAIGAMPPLVRRSLRRLSVASDSADTATWVGAGFIAGGLFDVG